MPSIRRSSALCLVVLFTAALAARAEPPVIGSGALIASSGLDEDEEDEEDEWADDEEDVGEVSDDAEDLDADLVDDEQPVDEEAPVDDADADAEALEDEAIDEADDEEQDGDEPWAAFDDEAEWAPPVEESPEDDAIPVDDTRYAEGWVWAVEQAPELDGGPGLLGSALDDDAVMPGRMGELRGGTREEFFDRDDARTRFAPRRAREGEGLARRAERLERAPADDDEPDEDVPFAFGGRPVAAMAVPWQAQIFNPGVATAADDTRPAWQRQHWCGGALIADDWVLTAAHCIDQAKVDLGFKVRLGSQDLSVGDGLVYRIDRIVRHSEYDANSRDLTRPPNMYANDIALVRIVDDGPPQRRDPRLIRPITLNRAPLAEGLPVSVTGWGATSDSRGAIASAVIVRIDLRAMDTATCEKRPKRAGKVHDRVFCAASPTQATCRGDSGGPVVPTNGSAVLTGLVSWGSSACRGHDRPGVYTRIDKYLDWIDAALRLPPPRNSLP